MTNRNWLIVLGALALLIVTLLSFACQPTFVEDFGSAVKERPEATPTALPAAETVPVSTLTADQAMVDLFPNYDATTQRAQWEPTNTERHQLGFAANVKTLFARQLWSGSFTENGHEQFLLLTRTQAADPCRDCQSLLGGALYEKSEAGWRLSRATKNIAWEKAADSFLQGRLVKIGAGKYGVLYRWRSTNNGYAEEGERLVAETGEELREIFSAIIAANNEANCSPSYKCWSYKSTLSFVPREGSDFYDLRVVTSGTKPDDDDLPRTFEEVKTFSVINNRYTLRQP